MRAGGDRRAIRAGAGLGAGAGAATGLRVRWGAGSTVIGGKLAWASAGNAHAVGEAPSSTTTIARPETGSNTSLTPTVIQRAVAGWYEQ